jgi:hypothetical protein
MDGSRKGPGGEPGDIGAERDAGGASDRLRRAGGFAGVGIPEVELSVLRGGGDEASGGVEGSLQDLVVAAVTEFEAIGGAGSVQGVEVERFPVRSRGEAGTVRAEEGQADRLIGDAWVRVESSKVVWNPDTRRWYFATPKIPETEFFRLGNPGP